MKIQSEKVDNIIIPFKDISDKECFVSVTEWVNGEGYDVTIDDGNVQTIQIHMDSLSALNIATEMLKLKISED